MKPTRKPSALSESLQRHLNAYALAASAAGMGMLAVAHPAEARVIYTPAHRYLRLNHPLGLDLNGDGIVDFQLLRSTFFGSFSTNVTFVSARGARSQNLVAGIGHSTRSGGYPNHAYALRGGRQIGPKIDFLRPGDGFMVQWWDERHESASGCYGVWANAKDRYLGLRFKASGKTHYGWARLSDWCGPGVMVLLTGYAYETIPNKPIIAGKTKGPDVITLEPGSLGALAAGASRLHSGK